MISLLSQAKPKANLLSTDYSHLIAIEWRPGGLAALAFTQQQSTLSLVKEAERSWSEQALAGGLEAKAGELIQFLTTSGFVDASQSTAMVVAIDPALVISKRFELPLLPEIAIHDAVMLELESRGIGPIDYVSDYVVHRPHPADHLVISSISAPRDLVQRLEKVSEQLDCALLSLTLGEFSLLPAMRPEPTQDAATVFDGRRPSVSTTGADVWPSPVGRVSLSVSEQSIVSSATGSRQSRAIAAGVAGTADAE